MKSRPGKLSVTWKHFSVTCGKVGKVFFLLSKFSKVIKNFLGQCLTWHKFPPKSRFFSWTYEVPTIVVGNTTDHYDLLNSLKENGGLILKPKQSAQRSISASVMAVSPRFSYFWKITPYALKRHRVKGCFCKVYRGNHAHSCIMGNQGKMAGNSKICFEIQSQLILPEFIYLMFFHVKRVPYELKETTP